MSDPAYQNVRPTLRLNGEPLDAFEEAVARATVTMPADGRAHAEVRLVNWAAQEDGGADFRFTGIALGDAVELFMGDETGKALFDGEVTALEERYGEGTPELVLLAEDRLHRLARRRGRRSFENQSADQLVRRLAEEEGIDADVSIDAAAADWHQLDESNLALIRRIAARYGLRPRLEAGTLVVKPEEPAGEPWRLEVGRELLQARLIADLNHQPTTALALGFNPATGEAVRGESARLDGASGGATAATLLEGLGWEGEAFYPRPFPLSQAQADGFAATAFAERAGRFIHGDLVCAGDPKLIAGGEVELEGVSPRLTGRYAVTACTHHYASDHGYETLLKVARSAWAE